MFNDDELLNKYIGEYRTGFLGKKAKTIIYIHEKHIDGIGATYQDKYFDEYSFDIQYRDIKSVYSTYINGIHCIEVIFAINENSSATFYLPNLDMSEMVIEQIRKIIEDTVQEKELEKRKALETEQRFREECQSFYTSCYKFHILKDNNPYFELYNQELVFAGVYVDRNRNLNFLEINGVTKEEYNACIPYEKIHYYEKAGSVHYATEINGTYASFGGTITGGTISKKTTLLGGLLFGPMGMAAGAVLSQKPLRVSFPSNSFDISSEIQRIDDRSVILNYFSDVRKQYIDIVLPADSFNFLQTHLAEKKYSIVLEIEKNNAVTTNENSKINNSDTEAFEKKVKKIKFMYDNGLLSDEEYIVEKQKLLSQIYDE